VETGNEQRKLRAYMHACNLVLASRTDHTSANPTVLSLLFVRSAVAWGGGGPVVCLRFVFANWGYLAYSKSPPGLFTLHVSLWAAQGMAPGLVWVSILSCGVLSDMHASLRPLRYASTA